VGIASQQLKKLRKPAVSLLETEIGRIGGNDQPQAHNAATGRNRMNVTELVAGLLNSVAETAQRRVAARAQQI
jgi:hypothetical protein